MMMARAIMIDPVARTVAGIEVPLTFLVDEPVAGPQVNFKELYLLLGCDSVEMWYLPNGRDAGLVDAEGLYRNKHFFQLGPDCKPIPGKCMIIGHDIESDSWQDVTVMVEDISRIIQWTRRVLRDVRTSTWEGPHGEPIIEMEAVLPIVDEK
jgi:hypothetical protein